MKRKWTFDLILRTLRAEIAKRLSKLGTRGVEISRVLDVSPACVTQYLKGNRGVFLGDYLCNEPACAEAEKIDGAAEKYAAAYAAGEKKTDAKNTLDFLVLMSLEIRQGARK